MSIDVSALGKSIAEAVLGVLQKQAPDIRDYAEAEGVKLAQTIAQIEARYAMGKITEEHARLLLEMQKNAARTVLLTIEGLGLLAVEAAINAGLDVIKQTVNKAVGFALIA
jgi:hypothetical protein